MDLTHSRVVERISYNPDSGAFTWLAKSEADRNAKWWNKRYAGTVAGRFDGRGYIQIGMDGSVYLAHRLAWFFMTGEWPRETIDHINGDSIDNRWSNLRKASISENCANQAARANNTSGFKGVYWHKAAKKWRRKISVNNKQIIVGMFDCPAAAHFAYIVAADNHFGEYARAR